MLILLLCSLKITLKTVYIVLWMTSLLNDLCEEKIQNRKNKMVLCNIFASALRFSARFLSVSNFVFLKWLKQFFKLAFARIGLKTGRIITMTGFENRKTIYSHQKYKRFYVI